MIHLVTGHSLVSSPNPFRKALEGQRCACNQASAGVSKKRHLNNKHSFVYVWD